MDTIQRAMRERKRQTERERLGGERESLSGGKIHPARFFNVCEQIEIFHQRFQCSPRNLSNITPTIYVTMLADECFKMKLLIDICTVLCRIVPCLDPS